jgi:hypothetical protein
VVIYPASYDVGTAFGLQEGTYAFVGLYEHANLTGRQAPGSIRSTTSRLQPGSAAADL